MLIIEKWEEGGTYGKYDKVVWDPDPEIYGSLVGWSNFFLEDAMSQKRLIFKIGGIVFNL